MEPIDMALPIVFSLVGIALVWFIVELAITFRHGRKALDDTMEQVKPVMENVAEMTESLKPAVAKVDPLVERVSLTVDAANLEMMRLDQIMEDLTEVTDSISSATGAIDTAMNAPVNALSAAADRVRGAFKGKNASAVSSALGQQKKETPSISSDEPSGYTTVDSDAE